MESKEQFEKYKGFGILLAMIFFMLDIYYNYFQSFAEMGITHPLLTNIIKVIMKTGLLNNPIYIKLAVLLMTLFFVLLDSGRKDLSMDKNTALQFVIVSTLLYLGTAFLLFFIPFMFIYFIVMIISYAFVITSYNNIHRLLDKGVMNDRYNLENKTFPQNTELIENELSVNIPYQFVKDYVSTGQGKKHSMTPVLEEGYINFISPDRSVIILGKPGSGKSFSFNEEFIRQFIMKGYSMINYDFKFPTLTNIAYNYYLTYKDSYNKHDNKGRFAVINLDDVKYSDRCNPIHKDILEKKQHAIDAVYTIFFNLDKKSAQKQDFFQMSAMSITVAALWFLRNYEDGRYCSFPHLIELIQQPDEKLLPILDSYPDLRYFTSAFTDALAKESFEQLSGQTASARIPLGKCATPEIFWVMTDPENTGINLKVNRPEEVIVLNIANKPETQKTNAPALGLYMSQAGKLINEQKRVPCLFHVDELPTIFINGLNTLIATGRSNKVCVVLSAQDYTQLVMDYGKETADTIFNTVGSIASGQVAIDTAKKISEAIGKINYQTQSVSINNQGTSTSFNTQRDYVVPPEDISQLSQGEFVGIVADTFNQKIKHKAFRGLVAPSKEDLGNESYPMINPNITEQDLLDNELRIQREISEIIENEINRINDANIDLQNRELEKEEEMTRDKLGNLPYENTGIGYDDDDDYEDIPYRKMPDFENESEINANENKQIVQNNPMISQLIREIKPLNLDGNEIKK